MAEASTKSSAAVNEPGALVTVHINGRKVPGLAGETLLQVADRAGGLLDSQCLAGACGTCMVRVVEGAENLVPPGGVEEIVLDPEQRLSGMRLGCQARLRGAVRIVSVASP